MKRARHGLGTACLLAFLAVGCSSAEKSQEACIDPILEPRLVVRVHAMDEGQIRLIVGREWTRSVIRTGLRGADVQVANGNAFSPVPQSSHGNVSVSGDPDSSALGQLGGYAVAAILSPIISIFKALANWIGSIDGGTTVEPGLEIVFDPAWKATIEPASGEFVINLGTQPGDGYVLDVESVRRLGRDVVVRDRDLSVALSLPGGR